MNIIICSKRQGGTQPNRDYPIVYVGRPHTLGNPFTLGRDGDRTEVIAKYRSWLQTQLRSERSDAYRAVVYLRNLCVIAGGVNLQCWCAPEACHADVVAEAIKEYDHMLAAA